MKPSRSILEFWFITLGPWILDLFGGRGVFTSIFGASVWGIAVALTVARSQTRDPIFRLRLGKALIATLCAWVGYWIYSFLEFPGQPLSFAPFQWLVVAHSGLLAAGAGMVLVLWLSSLLWLVQERLLKKTSWERRKSTFQLPSLEALAKTSHGTQIFAFASWGLGFFLAIISGALKWRGTLSQATSSWSWFLDSKVLMTAILWLLLVGGFQSAQLLSKSSRSLFKIYFATSTLFLIIFTLFMTGRLSALHSPVEWFIK